MCPAGGSSVARRTTLGVAGRRSWTATRPAVASPSKATSPQASRSRLRRRTEKVAGTPAWDPASPIQRSSLATSWALCQRSSGSFSRHLFTTWSSAAGITGWTDEIGGGCEARIAAIRLVFDLPSKARRPVAIS